MHTAWLAPSRYAVVTFSLALLGLAGCATLPPPSEQMAVTRTAVADAESAGAAEYASVDLRAAQDKLAEANVAMGARDYERAKRLAEESEADANVAAVRARSAKAQRAVAEVQESIRVLREELARAGRG
jgi:hypothetical protein